MIATIALAFAAMLAMSRATGRGGQPRLRHRFAMRLAGALLFVTSLLAAIGDLGVGIGIVAWLMALSIGALAVAALLTLHRPSR